MPKKKNLLLIGCVGCGGLVLLLVLTVVGGGLFIGYKFKQFGQEIANTYNEIDAEYNTLDERFAFSPPDDALMNEERVNSFLQIRANLSKFMVDHKDKLKEAGEKIGEQFDSPGVMSKIQGFSSIKEIVHLAVNTGADIGHEHIELLEADQMSPNEYIWLTKSYIGTLSKAKEEDSAPCAALWKQYLESLESARNDFKDVHINLGEKSIHGSDMNSDKLRRTIEDVAFQSANAQIIERTSEALILEDSAVIADFFALHFREIFNSSNRILHNQKSPRVIEF